MPNYLEYNFTVIPSQPGSDILIADLAEMGFDSFVENETGFLAYLNLENEVVNSIKQLQYADFTFSYQRMEIKTENWNAEWEKNFEPVQIGNLLYIRAPFHPEKKEIKHELIIMPKMSFGTGHHHTTRLICQQMLELKWENKRVLDMGCGTGILAILAKKLGAGEVLGVDIDEWSVENCRENCDTNNCKEIFIQLGGKETLSQQNKFDCILANINKNVLKDQMALYAKLLNPNGILLLSGFFTVDVNELKEVLHQHKLIFTNSISDDNWAMIEARG